MLIRDNLANRSNAVKGDGFTLLEVIVAISIFTIIAAVSYAAINGIVSGKQTIEVKRQQIVSMQRVYSLFKNDIRYALARSVRDELGDQEQALQVEKNGEIMRITAQYPSADSTVSIKRIAWELRDNRLLRKQFGSLDRVEGNDKSGRVLLTDVAEVNIYTHSFDSEESGSNVSQKSVKRSRGWPEENTGLPLAIEIEVLMNDDSRYRWLFDMASSVNKSVS